MCFGVKSSFRTGRETKCTIDLQNFASELELIATALYVYIQTKDKDKVKKGVLKIKGSKYSETRIDSAIVRLIRTGYIAA